MYIAPYDLTDEQKAGEPTFLLPVCTTPERLSRMVAALTEGGMVHGWGQIGDHNVDIYQALAHINSPETTDCAQPMEPEIKYRTRYRDCVLPSGVYLDGETLCICMEEFMGIINIYQNCGCGCGCGSGGSGGSSGSGGSGGPGGSGGSGDDLFGGDGIGGAAGINKCDVASYILPYVLDQAQEWFDAMDNYIASGGNVLDFFEEGTDAIDPTDITPAIASGLKAIVEALGGSVEQIRDMLTDTDFLLEYQESWWRATSEDNVMTGRITELTRADLRKGNRYIPLTWGSAIDGAIVLPRVTLDLFFSIINMKKVNRRLLFAQGQANTALCSYLANQIGETYEPGGIPGTVPPPAFTVIHENSLYQLIEIDTQDSILQSVGDEVIAVEFEGILSMATTMTLVAGTGFGNHMTISWGIGEDDFFTGQTGGDTGQIGISARRVHGDADASNYLKAQLSEYAAIAAPIGLIATPADGLVSVYVSANQADWQTRIDKLYLVLEK